MWIRLSHLILVLAHASALAACDRGPTSSSEPSDEVAIAAEIEAKGGRAVLSRDGRSPSIVAVRLYEATDDKLMSLVSSCGQLRSVTIDKAGITDDGIKAFARHKKLDTLLIDRVPITDRALDAIGKMPKLTELVLWRTSIRGGAFRSLRNLRELETLRLDNNDLARADFSAFRRLPSLDFVSLSNCSLTDEQLKQVLAAPSLCEINITHNPVSDTGAEYLLDCLHLEIVHVRGTLISEGMKVRLETARPELIVVP